MINFIVSHQPLIQLVGGQVVRAITKRRIFNFFYYLFLLCTLRKSSHCYLPSKCHWYLANLRPLNVGACNSVRHNGEQQKSGSFPISAHRGKDSRSWSSICSKEPGLCGRVKARLVSCVHMQDKKNPKNKKKLGYEARAALA